MESISDIIAAALYVKKPQLLGILAGCAVFTITIWTVLYLLYASGSFSKLYEEMNSEQQEKSAAFKIGSQDRGTGCLPQFTAQPELYDHLLEARSRIQRCPDMPVELSADGTLVSLLPFGHIKNKDKFKGAVIQAGNGTAIFGESEYDVSRIWGWLCPNFLQEIKLTAVVNSSEAATTHQTAQWAKQCFANIFSDAYADGCNGCHIIIIDKELNAPIGMLSLVDNDPTNLSVRIDHLWITPAFQGKNHVHSAFDLLLGWLVDTGYRRIVAHVDDRNFIARKALTKAGFTQEAVLFKHMVVCDRNCNTVVYTVLNSDWPTVKTKLGKILKGRVTKLREEVKHKIAGIDTYSLKLAVVPKRTDGVSSSGSGEDGANTAIKKRSKKPKTK